VTVVCGPRRLRTHWRVIAACGALLAVTAACVPVHATHQVSSQVVGHPAPTPTLRLPPNIDWRIHGSRGAGISGFADHTSVAPGDALGLYVSTRARTFTVNVFRMGWYDGTFGRLLETAPPTAGQHQASALMQAPTNTVVAPWQESLRLGTAGWPPGDYLLRLNASDGSQSYVPLTVRAASAAGAVVLVSPVTTWQAYNRWGCCNLYSGADGSFATRSRAVSFDRPYSAERGAGEFIERELPVLAEAERLGLRLDYVTSVDLDDRPNLLAGAAAVVSMGHDEYWSPAMRAAVTAARDAGTNLAFLGANAMFRRIRFAESPVGRSRVEVDYKVGGEDPLLGVDDPAVTTDWPDAPDPQPESLVVGAAYSCFTHIRTAGVVVDASSPFFRGTHLADEAMLPKLIGAEIDQVFLGPNQPRPVEILLHSPFPCAENGRSVDADATYYTAPSGAGVFDAGTQSWVCAMGATCTDAATAGLVRRITDNVLLIFATGPAAKKVPAIDNVARVLALSPPFELLPQPVVPAPPTATLLPVPRPSLWRPTPSASPSATHRPTPSPSISTTTRPTAPASTPGVPTPTPTSS